MKKDQLEDLASRLPKDATAAEAADCTVPSGYRYKFEGKRDWRTSSDDRWDTVAGGKERGVLLGYRQIDGSSCAVVRLGGSIVALLRQNLVVDK